METVFPVEIEMGSLRVDHEQQISKTEWAQAQFDQPNHLDEKRLRATDHVQAYQRKMARVFKKRAKPRPLQKWDLVLRILRGLVGDPRGKFRPSWGGPYVFQELTPEGRCMVDRLRWKLVFRADQCGLAKEVLRLRLWSQDEWSSYQLSLYLITFIDILDRC